jgi:hypothetical protein
MTDHESPQGRYTRLPPKPAASTTTPPQPSPAVAPPAAAPAPDAAAPAATPVPAVVPSTASPQHPTASTTPSAPTKRSPTPTTKLLAELQGLKTEQVERLLEQTQAAWRGGDQTLISNALIEQATILDFLGARLVQLATNHDSIKVREMYLGLAMRAYEAARKTWGTLNETRQKPRVTTAVQVNVEGGGGVRGVVGGGSSNEVLAGDGDE